MTAGRTASVRYTWPGRCQRRSDAKDRCPSATRTSATSADTGSGPCGSPAEMATRGAAPDAGPGPRLPQGHGRSKEGEPGRCPADMATPATRAGTGTVLCRHPGYFCVAVRHAVPCCGHLRTAGRVRCHPGGGCGAESRTGICDCPMCEWSVRLMTCGCSGSSDGATTPIWLPVRRSRGTGRWVGGRWWDAASAGGREQAGRSAGRGVGRGHRSSPGG
jgi:hypothetical protein